MHLNATGNGLGMYVRHRMASDGFRFCLRAQVKAIYIQKNLTHTPRALTHLGARPRIPEPYHPGIASSNEVRDSCRFFLLYFLTRYTLWQGSIELRPTV